MKKVYCNNLLAKVLLAFSSCHTITIGPFVLSKRPEEKITQKVRNHECTHARQWVEMAVAIGTVIWIDPSKSIRIRSKKRTAETQCEIYFRR